LSNPVRPNPASDRTLPGHEIRPAGTRKLIATVLKPEPVGETG
jgi:hypothetical protein